MATYWVMGEKMALVPIRSSNLDRYHVPVAVDPFHLIARGEGTTLCGLELTGLNRSAADWNELPTDVRCRECDAALPEGENSSS